MTMILTASVPTMLLLFAAGGALGLLFFGGLWWTLQRLQHSSWPALLMLGSLALRSVVVTAAFYWLMHHDWQRLLFALAGFVLVRIVLTRRLQPASAGAAG